LTSDELAVAVGSNKLKLNFQFVDCPLEGTLGVFKIKF